MHPTVTLRRRPEPTLVMLEGNSRIRKAFASALWLQACRPTSRSCHPFASLLLQQVKPSSRAAPGHSGIELTVDVLQVAPRRDGKKAAVDRRDQVVANW